MKIEKLAMALAALGSEHTIDVELVQYPSGVVLEIIADGPAGRRMVFLRSVKELARRAAALEEEE